MKFSDIKKAYDDINDAIEGWPDKVLTILILLSAAAAIVIALAGTPAMKGITLAWIIIP